MGKNRRETAALPIPAAPAYPRGLLSLLGARISWSWALILLLAVCAVYSPALKGSYVWDDDQYVSNLVYEKPDALRRIWIAPETAQYYPLAYTAFYVQKKLWNGNPSGFHAVNVLLHFLDALLVWIVLLKLGVPAAGFAAALFALHPVHVESVAWISELKNVLSGFFYLLAFARWLDFEETGDERDYRAALALFVPALLTKTVVCTMPAAFFIVRWYRGRSFDRAFLLRTAPFFLLTAAAAVSTVAFEMGHAGEGGTELILTFPQRLIVAGHALWFYASKLLWPRELIFNYVRWAPDAGVLLQWLWPLSAAGAAAAAWLLRERMGRGPLAAAAFFAVTLSPALGFFYIYPQRYSYVADHFQYLSTIGPAALFAAAFASLISAGEWLSRRIPPALVLAVLSALSWRLAGSYQSSAGLWQSVLLQNPSSFLAHNNLGLEYAAGGLHAPAADHFRLALKANPTFAEAHNNLGLALINLGRPDEAESHIKTAIALNPSLANPYNNLGLIMEARGRTGDALKLYEKSLSIRPGYALAHYNIGNVHARAGRMAEAERDFKLALAEWPDYSDARVNLANVMAERGDPEQAILEYQRALRAKIAQPIAHNNLANVLMSLGRVDEASEHYRAAIALKPDFAEALNNLGNAAASAGRPDEAAALYRRALAARPGFAAAAENLKRAEAERSRTKRPAAP